MSWKQKIPLHAKLLLMLSENRWQQYSRSNIALLALVAVLLLQERLQAHQEQWRVASVLLWLLEMMKGHKACMPLLLPGLVYQRNSD